MSANWAVRSLGKPYFALTQRILDGMGSGGLYSAGLIEYVVRFRLFALPVMNASASERHPLIAVADLFGAMLMEVGVTPLGAISAATKNGAVAVTGDGALIVDNQWHTLDCSYDTGTGALIVSLDARPVATGSDGGGDLLPTSAARIIMFNGPTGIARTDVAIREATVYSTDGTGRSCTYLFDEKAGDIVAGTKASESFPDVYSFDLTAEFMQPLGHSLLWGPIPSSGLENAYRWQVDTDYTELGITKTVYEEVDFQ